MSVGVQVDVKGVKELVAQKALDKGRYAMANQMLADMNMFVPAREFILRGTGHVNMNGSELIWNTPYARAQFYGTNGKATFRKYTVPGTGARWDLKAKSMFMSDWIDSFTKGAGW